MKKIKNPTKADFDSLEPGTLVIANTRLHGHNIPAIIQRERIGKTRSFVCQDEMRGFSADNKLGSEYSWCLWDTSDSSAGEFKSIRIATTESDKLKIINMILLKELKKTKLFGKSPVNKLSSVL